MASGKHPNDDPRPAKAGKSRFTQAWGSKGAGGDTAMADWGVVSPVLVQELIRRVTEMGALISFGYSRDRGAYLISVIDGDVKHKEWIPGNTDVDLAIELLCNALD